MGSFSVNNQAYQLKATGKVEIKPVTSAETVKQDYKDDIIVDEGKAHLTDISADELDIEGSWLKPFVGLPKAGDAIHFVDAQSGREVKGKVVASEDENDAITYVQRNATQENFEKQVKQVQQTLDKGIENVQKSGQKLSENIQKSVEKAQTAPPPTEREVQQGLNQIVDKPVSIIREAVKEITGETLTVGQTETFKKGDLSTGITISGNPTLNASYTLGVSNLDEKLQPFGNALLDEPHSQTLFVAHAVETRLGPSEISVGYKTNLGVEFNRPANNDFSASIVGAASVGTRPGGSAFMGIGLGVEGRYQINNKITAYGGPMYRGTLAGDSGNGGGLGLEAGIKINLD